MGTYTDWFIARAEEAEELAKTDDPFSGRWPHLALKSVIESDLHALVAILTRSEVDDAELEALYESPEAQAADRALATMSEEERAMASELGLEGAIVLQVPPRLIDALAELDEARWPDVATRWAADVEMVDAALLEEHLADMVHFARRARSAGDAVLQLVG